MCGETSIAVFCSESIEWFPGIASRFFLKLLITIPVPPILTGIIVHFRFHICCISIPKLLYLTSFSLPFAYHHHHYNTGIQIYALKKRYDLSPEMLVLKFYISAM